MTDSARYKLMKSARRAVRSAVERGILVKPNSCQKCGKEDTHESKDGRSIIQGHHHKGYDLVLEIEWLCIRCHRAETPVARGTRAPGAKLNDELVKEIRERYFAGEGSNSLGREYGVDRHTIHCAAIGRNWGHV